MSAKNRMQALAYLRTSSAANVGADKDSDKRQRQAIEGFAKSAGYELVGEHYDMAVSGADPIEIRPGFAAMIERIEANGARTIIVETANRFARDLMVQEVGFARLKAQGVTLIAADSPTAFVDDTPTARLVRQVLGAIAEFDKTMTVAKLKGARERKRREKGRCEGRKSRQERLQRLAATDPTSGAQEAATRLQEAVAMAKRLRRANPVTGKRRSLRKIAAELEAAGHLSETGQRYSAKSIQAMVGR